MKPTEHRTKDGVEEHRHEDRDYWHPEARIHTGSFQRLPFRSDHIYDVDEDGVYDIIESMAEIQPDYIDIYGEIQDLPWVMNDAAEFDTLSPDWAIAVSEISNIETQITCAYGRVRKVRVSSCHNGVEFVHGRVYYDPDTILHHAKLILETGLAAKYIRYPLLSDAMHLLHVAGDDRHYDLIRLPSGGHIPVDILEVDYEVSWETIAQIPLGRPRDCETFTCPICGEKSYFAGPCPHCRDICADCEDRSCGEDCPCKYYEEACSQLKQVDELHDTRKDEKRGEILRLIKSGNWKQCRYIKG